MQRLITRLAAFIAAVLILNTFIVYAQGQNARPNREKRGPTDRSGEPTELTKQVAPDAGAVDAPLLFCIGLHIEPFGTKVSELGRRNLPERPGKADDDMKPDSTRRSQDYNDKTFFNRHIADIRALAGVVARHNGKLTVQAQTAFTRVCVEENQPILADLMKAGHEIALHFHEDTHLGKKCEFLPADTWSAVMKEEIAWIGKACPGANVRYWSGGNNYPNLLAAADAAGLQVMSDHKNPKRQQTFPSLLAVNPWRPSGGPTEDNVDAFAKHDSKGKIIYLPDGIFPDADFAERKKQGPGHWFDVMTEGLELSLKAARKDQVNVFHITVHPGEFRGGPGAQPFETLDQWLARVVDPLVKAGKIKWATYSEMAGAFTNWEKSHPGTDPRSGVKMETTSLLSATQAISGATGYITFAINIHDWVYPDESSATLLRLSKIFQKYNVRGDFYFTAPALEKDMAKRPELVPALIAANMTISYHLRPPHPAYIGFDGRLKDMEDHALAKILREYETYQLDLTTGDVQRDQSGGYAFVTRVFGKPPVTVSPQTNNRRIKSILDGIYKEMGAKMVLMYHESGTALDNPYEYKDNLLVRPSDFSITRWPGPGETEDSFWWNRLDGSKADPAAFDPVARLKSELIKWKAPRPPFVTVLIHENNFYHFGPEAWKAYYLADPKGKEPLQPPYNLNARDKGRMRSVAEKEKIFNAYERLVAYAAANMKVVTSEDIVKMAQSAK